MKTVEQIIEIVNPQEIIVKSVNYLQCYVNDKFVEIQKDYHKKQWYQFQTYGKSISPREKFIKWID